MTEKAKISLNAQIEEVQYELSQRERVYPRLVLNRTARQGECDLHVKRMEAVRDTLLLFQRFEKQVRELLFTLLREADAMEKAKAKAKEQGNGTQSTA